MKVDHSMAATTGRLRAVSFDLAGTLIRTAEPVGRVYARSARAYGLEASEDELEKAFARAIAQAPPLAFGELSPQELTRRENYWWMEIVLKTIACRNMEKFDQYFQDLFSHYSRPSSWRLTTGARETLTEVRRLGLKTLLISNFDSRATTLLAGLGLAPLIDQVTISSRAGASKPAPEIFHLALKAAGLVPHQVMHVGDSARNDFLAAQRAGLKAVYITSRQEAAAWLPSPRIASLPELLSLLTEPTRSGD